MSHSYYVIMDFECTCWKDTRDIPHEIIEFPAIFLNARTLTVDYEFRRFVRPVENPILTDFCVELTGITDKDLMYADELDEVLRQFDEFLKENDITKFIVCTDGPWDFDNFLYPETKRKKIEYPSWACSWLDIRRRFQHSFKLEHWASISSMLDMIGASFVGRPHSGLDDARNIAKIVAYIHKRDEVAGRMRPNRRLKKS